ncbi:MAG: hypothetical protein Kow00107_11590 [Planctomycetota bacterium]
MRKALFIGGAVLLTAALALVAVSLLSGGRKQVIVYSYSDDPFRAEVANSMRSTLASLGVHWDEVKVENMPAGSTSDDVPWDAVSPDAVTIVMLTPGIKPLPAGRLIVMGPLRNADSEFVASNRGRARFCISEFPVDLSLSRIASACALDIQQITVGIASPSPGLRSIKGFGANASVLCDDDGAFIESLGSLSCLFVLTDGTPPSVVERWADKCMERKIAIVVDRKGYLIGKVAAVVSTEPEGPGETLARLAWKTRNEGMSEEVRELAILFSAHRASVAAELNLPFDGDEFPPLP